MELLPIPEPTVFLKGSEAKEARGWLGYGSNSKASRLTGDCIVANWTMQCCGIGTLQGLSYGSASTWQEKAKYLASIYVAGYNPGHLVFTITDRMLDYSTVKALIELGAYEIARFPNLYHGPQMLHMFLVNIRDGVGRYFTEYGEPFAEQPNPMPPIPPRKTTPLKYDYNSDYATLPVRKKPNAKSSGNFDLPQHAAAPV